MQTVDSAIIALNNLIVRTRSKKVRPENLLLLLSSCLQNSKCKQNLAHEVGNCKRCGGCKVGELLNLADRSGVRPFLATGGKIALLEARKAEIKAIVAVACEKDLREGILAAFPKRVLAVVNIRTCGPCRDCSVDVAEVEQAVQTLLENDNERGTPGVPE